VVDKCRHIGEDVHDKKDKNGVLIHLYGPDNFRSNSEKSFFTES
jgi:UDP-galactopyranose mutase